MDANTLLPLLQALESDRVERKETLTSSSKDDICKAICAFCNDLPHHQQPGYIFVGATDEGTAVGLADPEKAMLDLAAVRSGGNILPLPSVNVELVNFGGVDVLVIEVWPSADVPVRYKGVIWVRVGSSKARANPEDERRLNEKRVAGQLSFDRRALAGSHLDELDLMLFRSSYLPFAIAPEVLAENQRSVQEQLTSLRFLASPREQTPTAAGILILGKDPRYWLPGAYIQFLRVEGIELDSTIIDSKELSGTLSQQLTQIDEVLKANIRTQIQIPETGPEIRQPDYPIQALQQIIRNAVMHRNYQTSHAPIKVYWYADRIEISNPGGLFGQVTPENFGYTTDYRNPQIAEALKTQGYVQRFGMGIQLARNALARNGNPEPEFQFFPEYLQVTIRREK